jgi:hypothetical protein
MIFAPGYTARVGLLHNAACVNVALLGAVGSAGGAFVDHAALNDVALDTVGSAAIAFLDGAAGDSALGGRHVESRVVQVCTGVLYVEVWICVWGWIKIGILG